MSNTYNLLNPLKKYDENIEWGGLLIEADNDRFVHLEKLYVERKETIKCLNVLVELDGPCSLSNIMKNNQIPNEIDFITIDVDGCDYHLWKDISKSYHPRIVCVEFNPTIPNNVYFIQEADIRIQQGSSLLAIVELGLFDLFIYQLLSF